MTTDIELRQNRDLAVADTHPDYAMNELILWAQGADAAYRIAGRLAETSFVPGPLQRKPAEIAAAILTGKEIGLEPMAALRSINVIQGTPTINAQAMRGLVQSAGHEVWVVESTASRCVMRGRRGGSSNVQEVSWTLDRARGLNLLSKDNWKKQPQAMLVARATAEICRWVASDVLIGVPYATEELDDDPTPVATSPEVKPARRTAQRALKAVVEPMPETEPSLDEADKPSQAKKNMMFALFGKVGPADRDDRLKFISELLGRTITSSDELTTAEVSIVIDDLKAQEVANSLPVESTFDDDWPETAEAGS
jgi:hypothetical protein